ncbi:MULTISPECIES: hypothetical protein [unclassified Chelatococcus]|uniref:hypothetical protein n=1 Tax=unclassified Chelatococcus TaxID=2638111 RepID=UPI00030A9879|nr:MULTISPECIES: hypothetical protein [unclassified Chelatococcus]ALA17857.1 hypothetical protein AL346_11120 [Chelatococcus sp. CO-6]
MNTSERRAFAAMAFINGAFHHARRGLPAHLRAALSARIADAVRAGASSEIDIAMAALRAEGLPAEFRILGGIGMVVLAEPPAVERRRRAADELLRSRVWMA